MPDALLPALLAFGLVLATGLVWFRRVAAVAVPTHRGPFVAVMALGAGLGGVALLQRPGAWVAVPAVLSVAAGALFLVTVAISGQRGGAGAFRVGEPVPDFSAPDADGEPFRVSAALGGPLLLKFFRGHW